MKKSIKISIVVGLTMIIALMYYGKSIYVKNNDLNENKIEQRKDSAKGNAKVENETDMGLPVMLEFATST